MDKLALVTATGWLSIHSFSISTMLDDYPRDRCNVRGGMFGLHLTSMSSSHAFEESRVARPSRNAVRVWSTAHTRLVLGLHPDWGALSSVGALHNVYITPPTVPSIIIHASASIIDQARSY